MKFLILLLFSIQAWAEEPPPLWEYGVGVGGLHYEQYPASEQFSDLILPFPTFQYRGEILRADDREGTRAYLYKRDRVSLQFSGGVFPALDSSNNRAREGMENLPWMILLGPQWVFRQSDAWEMSASAFQATSSDFHLTKTAGYVLEGKVEYQWFPAVLFGKSRGQATWRIRSADRQLNAIYYEVSARDQRPGRGPFEACEGLLRQEISYFQSFTSGRTSLYLGGSWVDYSISANRASPLHKTDGNLTYLAGLTYVLGESRRESVPVEATEGIINRYQNLPR